jgi:hypothetical protein
MVATPNASIVNSVRLAKRDYGVLTVDPTPSWPNEQTQGGRGGFQPSERPAIHIDYKCIDSNDKRSACIDFVLELPTKCVLLELDERQHLTYDVSFDLSRMMFVTSAIACSRNAVDPVKPERIQG